MAETTPTILITDDEESIRNSLREILEFEDYHVLEAENGSQTFDILENHSVDLLLLDIKMKGMDGMEILEKLSEESYQFPVIMISGHGNIKLAVEATKMGAFDFIEKPPDLNRLLVSVRNALDRQKLEQENKSMRSKLPQVTEIIGQSETIENVRKLIEKVAPTHSRVLITGENGTGKELAARWIHEKSIRNAHAFVDVNCAAIPSELIESELFGHEEGAFTGAINRRIGKFEQADGGTLFLDEIGDLSQNAQSKVLRALQQDTIVRVGASEKVHIDVRVIAATNKDLQKEIEKGAFREDLFHRINVLPIIIPPLRKRKNDIPLLAQHALEKLVQNDIAYSGIEFTDEALQALKEKDWSGNVRELQNAVERLALLADESTVTQADVEKLIFAGRGEKDIDNLVEQTPDFHDFKERAERLFLLQKLEENEWNISQTAEAINIQRSHMYNKMKKYDIER